MATMMQNRATLVSSRKTAAAVRPALQARRVSVRVQAQGPAVGLPAELKQQIDEVILKHKVVAFIKGTKQFPQCGFSNTVVQVRWPKRWKLPSKTLLAFQASCLLHQMCPAYKGLPRWRLFRCIKSMVCMFYA